MARRQLPTLSPRFEPTPINTNIFHRRERGDELKNNIETKKENGNGSKKVVTPAETPLGAGLDSGLRRNDRNIFFSDFIFAFKTVSLCVLSALCGEIK
jgi:hypothetical protein